LFAELAHENPMEKSWLIEEARWLSYLGGSLVELGKWEEAVGCATRALDLLDRSEGASGFERAQVLYTLAQLGHVRSRPEEADDFFRRAIAEYRKYLSGDKKAESQRVSYASKLPSIASRRGFATRYPDEPEKLLDESITLWREICGP